MAVLSPAARSGIFAAIQRWWSHAREECGFTKPELQAAIDATDDWIDANAANFNAALPVAFRTKSTATQKTILFVAVALKRAGLLTLGE